MPAPLISIVVPTFNRPAFLEEAVRSLLCQTHTNLEIVVQDGGDDEATATLLRRLASSDGRLTHHREPDRGQSDALQKGLLKCKGELWSWLCSDDRIALTDSFETLAEAWQSRASSSSAGVFGRAALISEDGTPVRDYPQKHDDVARGDLETWWPLAQPASLFRREWIMACGGIVSDMHLGMDLDLLFRLLEGDRTLLYVDHPIAQVRLHEGAKSVAARADTARQALDLVAHHMGGPGSFVQSAYWGELVDAAGIQEAVQFAASRGWGQEAQAYLTHQFGAKSEQISALKTKCEKLQAKLEKLASPKPAPRSEARRAWWRLR